MAFSNSPLNQENSSGKLATVFPKSLAELKNIFQSQDLVMDLVSHIEQEEGQKVRWADRQPLCAKELVQTLFSKKKYDQVVVPFFSICANDPGLKKALLRIGSHPSSDMRSEKVQGALEKNIRALAGHPGVFFELANESVKHQNRRLVQALLAYCDKNPEFVQKNLNEFSNLVKRALHLEDLVVVEYIIEGKLDRFLEKEDRSFGNNGGLDLGQLLTYKRWNTLDLLVQKGKVKEMKISKYVIGKGENPEKIDLLIANGAIVEKPFLWSTYEDVETRRVKRAYECYEMRKTLHMDDLSEGYLKTIKTEDLWWWLSFDRNAASVLAKHPDFFKDFLSKQSNKASNFVRVLKAYREAGIFDPIEQGIPLLFKAISSSDSKMAMALMQQGVPANAIDMSNGSTGFETALRSLSQDEEGFQLFEIFLNHPTTDCRTLFRDGSHPIDVLFQLNIPYKHVILKAMLEKGATLHGAKLSLLERAQTVQPYDVPALKLLISHGISLSERTSDKDTVLHVLIFSFAKATGSQREALLQLITHLAAHAPKGFERAFNNDGKTVLDLAKELNLPEVVLTLLQVGIEKESFVSNRNQELILSLLKSKGVQVPISVLDAIAIAYRNIDVPASASELRPWLTLTNFAYLFGDAIDKYGTFKSSKKGTEGRPGNSFNESGSFLTVLLSVCEKALMSKDDREAVANAKQKLESAVFCSKVLTQCSRSEEFRRRFLPVLSSSIEAQIAALPPGESLLIPSGWSGLEGRYHAMLIEVIKNPDGTCSLLVVNTDKKNGALLHAQRPTSLKSLINPIRTFDKIPQEKLFETELIPSLLSLLAHFPEDGANQYGDKDYYHLIFSRLSEHAAPLPEGKKLCFITAQRSGTCTIRCALAYLHFCLGTELYRKVKTQIEQIVFDAINDPEFIGKAAVNPDFLIHLEHAIERAALHVNKHKSDESLLQAKGLADLLSDVDKKISDAAEGNSDGSKKADEVVSAAGSPLERAATKLEESRRKLVHLEAKKEPLTPFEPLVPPSIDFSSLSSGEEWIAAIDQLGAFFEKSSQSPLDPNQTVATRLTTQALNMLALPSSGVFHPGIDAKTPIGSLSLSEKRVFRQKLGDLCQKYATALYNQRSAAAIREVERLGIWYGCHDEPYTEAESMEQYLCINKLFAHYWRLSLELEGEESGPASLSHYGIDISHLIALKNSIHLPCYSPQVAEQLNELIEFFEESHPAPSEAKRTLLAIGDWSKNQTKIVLPLKGKFGETSVCEEWYQRIPNKAWVAIDSKMNSVEGWSKPDLKDLRLAYLFAHPEMLQQKELRDDLSQVIILYSDLRKIAFTCWLFKSASHEDPVRFEQVEWSEKSKVLETKFVAKSRLKELEDKALESKDPFLVGKLGHHMLGDEQSALKRDTEQNDYTIDAARRVHNNSRRFYEIAQAEEFAVHRLLCHYQENISDLKGKGDQIFFQLVLFRKEQLAKALSGDPAIQMRLLHLIEQALYEFDLQLQADPTKEELLRAIIFLNAVKLRLDSYLPGSFSEKERQMLHKEISLRLEAMAVKESTPQSEAIQPSRLASSNRAELLLLWISALPSSLWTDFKSCEQALVYLGQFEFFVEQLGSNDENIDPTLRALAYQTVFAHLGELKEAFASQDALSRAALQIAGVYGINLDKSTVISGTFPQVSFVYNERLYEINLLSGVVVRDKAPLVNRSKILSNSVICEFSRGRKEPIEIYVLGREEKASRFYSLSQGCEYYFTVHKQDESNWETEVAWARGNETFCYMPFDTVPDELKRIALESTPKKDNYYYWISKGPSKIDAIIQNRATGIEEVILYADGTAERPSSKERWNYVAVESVPGLAALASMQSKEQVAVWEKADLPNVREVHCFGLKDSRGAPFRLEGGRDPGSLKVVNLPGYRLAKGQTAKGLGRHFSYVIVQNEKGKEKAIVPVKIWSEMARGSKNPERSYSCEEIAIDEKGNPSPSGTRQQLLLAYYFIGATQYGLALGLLKQIDSSRVYNPEELKMLGWIFLHTKQTNDHSPKAIALSLMAARLAKENLENFPDVYPRANRNPKVTGYYDEPKVWVQFWKGVAPFEKTGARSQTLHALLAEAFDRYYEVSSHCTPEFQVHGKLLDPFQEAQWLTEIISGSPDLTLLHRLKFLLTGEVGPLIEEAKPKFEISFTFAKEMTGFDWLHSIDASPDDYGPVLAFLNRVRPEKGLKEEFGKLFALATKGTAEEKNALLQFLKDMQHDPSEVNQLIRAILMSQLPPYDSGPSSSLYLTYESQRYDYYRRSSPLEPLTMSQAIVKKVNEIASYRHREGPTPSPYQGFYGDSSPEKQLTALVHEWLGHFFPSLKTNPNRGGGEAIPKIETLLPPLAQEKKEKLTGHYEHKDDVFISEMNAAAEQLFTAVEKEPSPTMFLPLPATLQKDPYFQMRGSALREDIEEGKVQNQSKSRFRLKEKGVEQLLQLQIDLNAKKKKLEEELKTKRANIKKLVKQVTGGSSREIEAQLLRLGKKDVSPKLDECIALFVQRDLSLYRRRMPFLSEKDCLDLNTMIGEYLLAATTKQRINRSLEKLGKVISCSKKGKSPDQPIHDLRLELKKAREFIPSDHPEMLVLEYYDNISLRKEQCENLIKMTTLSDQGKFPPILLQMIMSAGKTSVLGTLLAQMKADGYHLSMLFTPRSLLDTNAPETQKRNLSFFGQRGHTLTYNRGKAHFNVPHLLRLQHLLLHAIEHREYLILCPETLLSMQNQYIEAREKVYALRQRQLGSTPGQRAKLQKEIETWEAPAQELKKILHLFRKRGAATFDEIDTQFSPRKELNYPGIETTRLDKISVELVSALYEIASTDPDFKKMGLNLPENTQSRLVPSQMDKIKSLLAQKMLQAIGSNPLWCQHLGLGILCDQRQIEQLTTYFLNPESEAPDWIAALNASGSESDWKAAERLVLIRQEIAQWLPSCWKYSANEHFSRSREHPDYLAAKPNICASTPNESAEIAHQWELVNKTLQLYVSTGVDLNQTKSIVLSLQKLAVIQSRKLGADSETELKKSSIFDKTAVVRFFKEAAAGSIQEELDLMKLQVKDDKAMKKVQKVLNSGTAQSIRMIIQYLSEQVFPELEFHLDQIHNNTANLSGAVDSEQGYSGTTANPFIFSQAYLQDPEKRIVLDKGAYGRVIDTLCRANRTVHAASSKLKTAEDLMKAVHQKKSTPERNLFHAFIDIGAYFKGHTNAEVASSFLAYFSDLDQSPIEGILYYDDTNNQLACLKKGRKEPIFIESTDAKTIFAMTGLKKRQLFTFYDQFHTVGSNIIQDPDAKAFYTIGDKTVLRDELQGDMRMRGLLEEQEIEGIIPDDLIPLISHLIEEKIAEKPSIEQILLFGEVNGLLRDREDNLKAFSLKLNAAARKYVLDNLYISSGEEEETLYAAARTFFIKRVTEELFSQYGGSPKSITADKYIEALINHFHAKIELIQPHLPQSEVEALKKELAEISSISESYIPPQIDSRSQGEDNTVEKIADIEKKVDNLSELDLDTQKDLARGEKPRTAKEEPWNFSSLENLLQQLYSPLKSYSMSTSVAVDPMFQSLPDVMNTHGEYAIFSDSFTSEFLVSSNFIETVSGQSNLFEHFQKTPYETLLFKDPHSGKFHLLLLSSREAQGFFNMIAENGEKCPFTVLNGDGSFRAGAPVDLNAPEIEQLIIQMLFFSGRLSQLQQQKWEKGMDNYLLVNRAMKRDLFEAVILESKKFQDYEHSMLKRVLNAPTETISKVDPVLAELKAAYFALRRGHWSKCKESVEKHFSALEKERSEELSIVIGIARTVVRAAKSPTHAQWGSRLLLDILPFLPGYVKEGEYKPIEKMIESLKEPIGDELKTQIIQALMQIPEMPEGLIKTADEYNSYSVFGEKLEVPAVIETLKNSVQLLSKLNRDPLFEDFVARDGKQLLESCYPSGDEWKYREGKGNNPAIAFEAIMTLLRQDPQAALLLRYATPFLIRHLGVMCEKYLRVSKHSGKDYEPTEHEKKALQLYEEFTEKYCGICPELDQIFVRHLIQPIIQKAHKQDYKSGEYSETESFYDWEEYVKVLEKIKHPHAVEQAENLRLKFERNYEHENWLM